ncbi:hypothetical protein H4R33_001974 [Dimargaris cristalligena]|nr:hypothetical protein H4R33_001974 [Dimargaris cristalligena]
MWDASLSTLDISMARFVQEHAHDSPPKVRHFAKCDSRNPAYQFMLANHHHVMIKANHRLELRLSQLSPADFASHFPFVANADLNSLKRLAEQFSFSKGYWGSTTHLTNPEWVQSNLVTYSTKVVDTANARVARRAMLTLVWYIYRQGRVEELYHFLKGNADYAQTYPSAYGYRLIRLKGWIPNWARFLIILAALQNDVATVRATRAILDVHDQLIREINPFRYQLPRFMACLQQRGLTTAFQNLRVIWPQITYPINPRPSECDYLLVDTPTAMLSNDGELTLLVPSAGLKLVDTPPSDALFKRVVRNLEYPSSELYPVLKDCLAPVFGQILPLDPYAAPAVNTEGNPKPELSLPETPARISLKSLPKY